MTGKRSSKIVRRTTQPSRSTFIAVATYTATIANDASGNFSTSFAPTNFGLGAAATYQVTSPQLTVPVAGNPSDATRVRLLGAELNYLPFAGSSTAVGLGSGYAACLNSFVTPTITMLAISAAAHSRPIYIGKPWKLTWRPKANTDHLWIRSDVALTTLVPVDSTSSGFVFAWITTGGTASVSPGRLVFRFTLEVAAF